MDNIRNYLTPRGPPQWSFKDYSQPDVTPCTNKGSITLGISGGSFEKKFHAMRGRKSIGYELGAHAVENLVFPPEVEAKFDKIGVVADWPRHMAMPAGLVKQVMFFPIVDII